MSMNYPINKIHFILIHFVQRKKKMDLIVHSIDDLDEEFKEKNRRKLIERFLKEIRRCIIVYMVYVVFVGILYCLFFASYSIAFFFIKIMYLFSRMYLLMHVENALRNQLKCDSFTEGNHSKSYDLSHPYDVFNLVGLGNTDKLIRHFSNSSDSTLWKWIFMGYFFFYPLAILYILELLFFSSRFGTVEWILKFLANSFMVFEWYLTILLIYESGILYGVNNVILNQKVYSRG